MWDNIVLTSLGAVIGYFASLGAAKRQHLHNIELEDIKNLQTQKSTLNLLLSEMTTIEGMLKEELWTQLKIPSEYLQLHLHYSQDYFTLFNANCNNLGYLSNDKLRDSILGTYLTAKIIFEELEVNNSFLAKVQNTNENDENRLEALRSLLRGKRKTIKSHYAAFCRHTEDFRESLPAYIAGLDSERCRLERKAKTTFWNQVVCSECDD